MSPTYASRFLSGKHEPNPSLHGITISIMWNVNPDTTHHTFHHVKRQPTQRHTIYEPNGSSLGHRKLPYVNSVKYSWSILYQSHHQGNMIQYIHEKNPTVRFQHKSWLKQDLDSRFNICSELAWICWIYILYQFANRSPHLIPRNTFYYELLLMSDGI
jgi:hypothetical protein